MEQIRRCKQFICSHQEETQQEKITHLYTEDYRSLRKTEPSEKQKSTLQQQINFCKTFSFKSYQPHTYHNQHQKYQQSLNNHTNLIKDLNKEGFNTKNNEKKHMPQRDLIVHLSPQTRIPHSPPKQVHSLHPSSSQYSTPSPQIFKKKSLKVSAAYKISNDQENLQRKPSSNSSAFSTKHSDVINKKQGKNFYNICYVNRINQENIKSSKDQGYNQEANQVYCGDIHRLTKINQICVINRQQFGNNVHPSNYLSPLIYKSDTQNLQSKGHRGPQIFSTKRLSPRFYNSPVKNLYIKKKVIYQNKQSNNFLTVSSATCKTLIESLKQQFFIDKDNIRQKNQHISPINLINPTQNQIINNQYVWKQRLQPVIQLQTRNLKDYQYNNPLNTFTNFESPLQTKNIPVPLTKQFKDLKTVSSICSQKLQNSCIDINYIQTLKGTVTKLI